MHFLTTLAAAATEAEAEMPFPTVVYGIIAFAILMLFMFVTMSFRNVARRHSDRWLDDSEYDQPGSGGH